MCETSHNYLRIMPTNQKHLAFNWKPKYTFLHVSTEIRYTCNMFHTYLCIYQNVPYLFIDNWINNNEKQFFFTISIDLEVIFQNWQKKKKYESSVCEKKTWSEK